MTSLSPIDAAALGWFLVCWTAFNWLVGHSRWKHRTLSHTMDGYRHAWMLAMRERPMRMVDTQIISGLQQGTAFFASTALLALGGGFAMLNATERVLELYADLPFSIAMTRGQWEAKVLGLMMIFAYTFFKFGWAYRLFNYCSILVGAVPHDTTPTPHALAMAEKAAAMNILAGRHFNQGQRALFFSIGFMSWFAGPLPFVAVTSCVTLVLTRRQFFSNALEAARTPTGENNQV
ncbi:DUF599 family protein [Breoghania sp. L-A4]|uniref:DUF599 domain-containing protein n=1 Tax=Breoghania sp. L-A4 TaxID=2304600 RepID=UPI000E360C01|nr:DUF599 family protein [Breoghania sp. L-A4]AXS40901.1 DUF599 family protein [Breoghania sp. L-A4]